MYPYDSIPYPDPYSRCMYPGAGMQQPQPPQRSGIEVVPVQTLQQVEQVQVQPGTRKLIMVQNEPVVAMRVADNMGLVTTDYYQLQKFSPSSMPVSSSERYVTEEQLEARLQAFVDSLRQPAVAPEDRATQRKNNSQKGGSET